MVNIDYLVVLSKPMWAKFPGKSSKQENLFAALFSLYKNNSGIFKVFLSFFST
jgi:hypothetical protein